MEACEKTGSGRLYRFAAAHQRISSREILNGNLANMLDHERWCQ